MSRTIDFGRGATKAVTIPWGDVASAFYSTHIPNIEVYLAARFATRAGVKLTRIIGPILAMPTIQKLLKRGIHSGPREPPRSSERVVTA